MELTDQEKELIEQIIPNKIYFNTKEIRYNADIV
jgi:hypothetical protein